MRKQHKWIPHVFDGKPWPARIHGSILVCWSQTDSGDVMECLPDASGNQLRSQSSGENVHILSSLLKWLHKSLLSPNSSNHTTFFSGNAKTWCFYIQYDPFPKETNSCISKKFFSFASSKLTVCSALIPSLAHTLPFQIIFS